MFNKLVKSFLKLNPSYYAFLSAVLIGPIVGLLGSAIYSIPEDLTIFKIALLGSSLYFLAGLLSLAISIELESLYHLSYDDAPHFADLHDDWETIIKSRIPKLSKLFIGIFVSLLLGTFAQGYAIITNTTNFKSINSDSSKVMPCIIENQIIPTCDPKFIFTQTPNCTPIIVAPTSTSTNVPN
jgi:hypothetical protein